MMQRSSLYHFNVALPLITMPPSDAMPNKQKATDLKTYRFLKNIVDSSDRTSFCASGLSLPNNSTCVRNGCNCRMGLFSKIFESLMKLETNRGPEAELMGSETTVDAKTLVEVMDRAKVLTKECEALLQRRLI